MHDGPMPTTELINGQYGGRACDIPSPRAWFVNSQLPPISGWVLFRYADYNPPYPKTLF